MDEENEKVEKVCGYLELRRWNPFRRWKKFWFVLDTKTLFYYESQKKYERLGRCKGSINMAMAQAVHPCSISRSYPIEIVTRTKIIVLSACDEENRQKWLRALLNSLHLPEISSPIMRRLTSRISGFIPDDTENLPHNDTNTLPITDKHRSETRKQEFSHVQLTTRASTSQTVNTESDAFQRMSRSLYEEIVEEVVLLTGRKLMQLESSENKRQSQRPIPPKPPRITRKSSYRCTLELDLSTQEQPSVELKTDDNSELYESANESCYITAESSEYESDSSSTPSTRRQSVCSMNENVRKTLIRSTSLSTMKSTEPQRVLPKYKSLDYLTQY